MFGWLSLLKFFGPMLFILAAYGFGSTYVTDYRDKIAENENLKGRIEVLERRELSYKSRIDIRDQAIANSKCAKQIQGWVMKPSTLPSPIPKPFSIPGQ